MPAHLHEYRARESVSLYRVAAAALFVLIVGFLLFPKKADSQSVRNDTTVYGAEGNLYGTAGRGTGESNIHGTAATNNGSGQSSLYGFAPGSTATVTGQALHGDGASTSASGSQGGPTGSLSDAPNSHGGESFYGNAAPSAGSSSVGAGASVNDDNTASVSDATSSGGGAGASIGSK